MPRHRRRHRCRRPIGERRAQVDVHAHQAPLRGTRGPASEQLRQQILLASVRTSGVERVPAEADRGPDVEGLRGPRQQVNPPPACRRSQVDRFLGTVVVGKKARPAERSLPSVAELVVAHPSIFLAAVGRSLSPGVRPPRVPSLPPGHHGTPRFRLATGSEGLVRGVAMRVRRDLVVHDVGYLSEQLLEHERPPLAERRPTVSGLCSVGKVTVGDAERLAPAIFRPRRPPCRRRAPTRRRPAPRGQRRADISCPQQA